MHLEIVTFVAIARSHNTPASFSGARILQFCIIYVFNLICKLVGHVWVHVLYMYQDLPCRPIATRTRPKRLGTRLGAFDVPRPVLYHLTSFSGYAPSATRLDQDSNQACKIPHRLYMYSFYSCMDVNSKFVLLFEGKL